MKPSVLCGIIAATVALYPLSAGPAYKLIESGVVPETSEGGFDAFYRPLVWLGDKIPLLGDAFLIYVSLWVDISL